MKRATIRPTRKSRMASSPRSLRSDAEFIVRRAHPAVFSMTHALSLPRRVTRPEFDEIYLDPSRRAFGPPQDEGGWRAEKRKILYGSCLAARGRLPARHHALILVRYRASRYLSACLDAPGACSFADVSGTGPFLSSGP